MFQNIGTSTIDTRAAVLVVVAIVKQTLFLLFLPQMLTYLNISLNAHTIRRMSRLLSTRHCLVPRYFVRPLSVAPRLLSIDTKKMIMEMRKETQLPLKNCREALIETDWDFVAAKVHLKKEAKRLGLKKMASLASRAVTEGLVGAHIDGDKVAMVIVNCESEPVAKTDEFNKLLEQVSRLVAQQEPGNYAEEAVLKMDGVHDAMVDAIGLLRENIRIKKAQVVTGKGFLGEIS